MNSSDDDFSGETGTNAEFEAAVREIRESLAKHNPMTLETAKLVKRHHRVFPGLQKTLAEQLNMNKSTFNKYLRVAGCGMFYSTDYKEMLPAGLSLLYELALIKNLNDAFRNGHVRADLTRVEIQGLRISYDQPRLPWNESPSVQADLDTAMAVSASSMRSRRAKPPKIPTGMCALIKVPETSQQHEAVLQALKQMREAGVVVYDGYTRDEEGWATAERRWSKKRDRLVTKAVRAKIKKLKKDFKPTPNASFESVHGSPDELELDGTFRGAQQVSEYIEESDAFKSIVSDIYSQLGGPDYTPKMPFFDVGTDDPRQMLVDLGLSKPPKEHDFSGLDFSS